MRPLFILLGIGCGNSAQSSDIDFICLCNFGGRRLLCAEAERSIDI